MVTTATASLRLPSDDEIRRDLLRKFRWLLRLRRDAREAVPPAKDDLRSLAAEFPGALRELDDTPLETFDARVAELERLDAMPLWATATWLYHAALREQLEATREGQRSAGGVVEVALKRVAATLGIDEAEATRLAIPHARRRANARRSSGR